MEEWADYITFLGRLLKALSLKPSGFTEIPRKHLIAKRLSQCLNPILPSGVHQKTLEVYAYVFSTLGKEDLAADLGLYLPGLSPVLSFAALSVKPNVLTVFENHIIPLKSSALRPALKSICLALLPGLEEENSDEFDRTIRLLAALKRSIARDSTYAELDGEQTASDEQYFWQCLFLASITSPTRRSGALAYLVRNLPQLGNTSSTNNIQSKSDGESDGNDAAETLSEVIDAVVSPEPGLLVRCFCAGLQDERLLIQRGFLDLLVTNLPLNSHVLQEKVISADLEKLVIAATSVVARKDMSLNRRLWSWFLGPEPTPESNGAIPSPRDIDIMSPYHNIVAYQTMHFEKFGLKPLISGISAMIASNSDSPVNRTKALRICLSLMDRWEIGALVIPKIFLPAMRSVWTYQNLTSSQDSKNEVLRSANMFFDGVESSLIWSEIYEINKKALDCGPQEAREAQSMLEMVLFMVTSFNIREEEMQTVHMPLIILMILVQTIQSLESSHSKPSFGKESSMSYGFKIVSKLLELVPPRALIGPKQIKDEAQSVDGTTSAEDISCAIHKFYRSHKGNIDIGRPFTEEVIGRLILDNSFSLVTKLLNLNAIESYIELDQITTLLKALIKKGTATRLSTIKGFLAILLHGDEEVEELPNAFPKSFAITAAKVAVIEAIFSTPESSTWISAQSVRNVLPPLVREIWPALSASRPKHNVEAVRAIWNLYTLCQERQLIDSIIVTLMIQEEAESGDSFIGEESARKFTILWAHSQTITASMNNKQASSLRSKAVGESILKATPVESFLERPLMLLLDALDAPKCSSFSFVVGWLQSLSSLAS